MANCAVKWTENNIKVNGPELLTWQQAEAAAIEGKDLTDDMKDLPDLPDGQWRYPTIC